MARRKQRNPQHFESPQELATTLKNGIQSDSDSAAEEDEHVCGKCRAEFPTLGDFLQHKKQCTCKRPVLLPPLDDEDEEEDEDDRRHSANAAAAARVLLLSAESGMRQDTNVALLHLKNTTVAVAQRGIYLGKQAALKEFFVKFQQKQIESLQLIQTIEDIILKSGGGAVPPPLIGTAALTPPESAEGAPNGTNACTPARSIHVYEHCGKTDARCAPTGSACPQPGSPPPEASSLQLLERHAERCLRDSAPRRTLLLDEELKPGERGHRCHFCGKLLGSDSALQIHLRSHTGEKPFRCNVCGSSFSTRGNLKVHSQRHRDAADSPKPEQALDFSTSMNGDANSHSSGSHDNTSNCSDNSAENSVDAVDNYGELKIDVERFDEEDDDDQASNSNDLDDEDDERASSEPIFDTSPTFAPYFLPTSFPDGSISLAPVKSMSDPSSAAPMNNGTTNGDDSAAAPDPTIYQDLLPRIGSNDNSWESLIEVTRTSETSKLQQLVDNIEHKLTDPNQCIICHRVLSCKSALQMHYRTHTGERPFKCKLCRRAFTTKGNLKTHMGVHRVKPPARVMHQCPVCHKQFANSVILQQHIRNHTGDGTLVPQLLSSDKPPTLLPPSYPRQFLIPPHLMKPEPLALTSSKSSELGKSPSDCETVIRTTSLESVNKPTSLSPVASCSPAPRHDESPTTAEQRPPILDLAFPHNTSPRDKAENTSFDDSKVSERSLTPEKNTVNGVSNVSDTEHDEAIQRRSSSPQLKNSKNESDKTHITSSSYSMPIVSKSQLNRPIYTSQSINLPLISLASDRPLPMTLPSDCPISFNVHGADRPYPPMSMSSCTTEYTASLAALENHVKAINSSATHSLPFPPHFGLGINMANYYRDFAQPYHKSSGSSPSASKNGSDASADDRSTPGGMIKRDSPKSSSTHKAESAGALDLTPRSSPAFQRSVTDLKMFTPLTGLPFPPPNHRMNNTTCKVCYKTFACHSALEIHYRSHTKERPFRCEVCDRGFSTKGNMRQHMMTHKIRDLPEPMYSPRTPPRSNVSSISSVSSSISNTPATAEVSGEQRLPKKDSHESSKRPATDSVLPPTPSKRSPGHSKHLCQVCNKPFSSGSALQIHMRTHTGDKPFQCHICHRAFTTKGNLKVHMGTHMYNNSTSRRGRRMSLDLSPLQLQHAAGKPMDFSQARPELFYPYLPAYVNGLTQSAPHNSLPPKMNEISVIQTAGVNNSVVCTSTPTSMQPMSLVTTNNSSNQNQGIPQEKDHPPLLPQVGELGSWPWKISCNICNKICSSSTDLELHIRNNHCKKESQETSTQSPRNDTSA